MGNIKVSGIDEFVSMLKELDKETENILKAGVYEGAGIIADEVRASLSKLDTTSDEMAKKLGGMKMEGVYSLISDTQKAEALEALGLSTIQNKNGFINTKLGFHGGNFSIKSKKYPGGQPMLLILRSVEYGSSAHRGQRFFHPAVKAAKSRAKKAAQKTIEEEIKKIVK